MNDKTKQHGFNVKKLAVAMALAMSPAIINAQFGATFELSSLDGNNGFVLNGASPADWLGRSVSSAGDINGDGLDDLIVGASRVASGTGAGYVVFGDETGFGSIFEVTDLNGSNGFVLNGVANSDYTARSVSATGDINGDGIDDLIIGAFFADSPGLNSGVGYVVFGKSTGFDSVLELSGLNGNNGFKLSAVAEGDYLGTSVSGAGDINGDGIDDLLIGARRANSTGNAYVVFGNSAGFDSTLELSGLNGNNGFVLKGVAAFDLTGYSVSDVGDINGDGIGDLIVGAFRASTPEDNSGASYVVFGNSTGFGSVLELSGLNGSNGFLLKGISNRDYSGRSVSNAGDVNGDGLDDLIVGAPRVNSNDSGGSYVVFGNSTGFDAAIDLSELNGNNGFVLNGVASVDRSGVSVSSAGDVNGDGLADLLIGAYRADPNANDSGASYVVFGNSAGFAGVVELSDLNGSNGFVLNGEAENDLSGSAVSNAGDINGDGIDDLVIGSHYANPNGGNSGTSYVVFGSDVIFADGFE